MTLGHSYSPSPYSNFVNIFGFCKLNDDSGISFSRQNIVGNYNSFHTCPSSHWMGVNTVDAYLRPSDGSLRIATLSDKAPSGNHFLVGLIQRDFITRLFGFILNSYDKNQGIPGNIVYLFWKPSAKILVSFSLDIVLMIIEYQTYRQLKSYLVSAGFVFTSLC